jgi:DNA-binding winged helix-turn-helix (wHTH) protein
MTAEVRFGAFRPQPDVRVLVRDGEAVPLTARAFAVLQVLTERAGQLVSKEELMQRVRAGVVVEENNLAVQVGALRKLLGAEAIATVAGRDYRFAMPLTREASVHRSTNLPAPGMFLSITNLDMEGLLKGSTARRHRRG